MICPFFPGLGLPLPSLRSLIGIPQSQTQSGVVGTVKCHARDLHMGTRARRFPSASPAAETESPGAGEHNLIVCPHCPGGTGHRVGGAEAQDLPLGRKGVLEWLPVGLPASSSSCCTVRKPVGVRAQWLLHSLSRPQCRTPRRREESQAWDLHSEVSHRQGKEDR